MTREERSGWRDEWMSRWHRRKLSDNEPCHDIDSVEWRNGSPIALIEWKYSLRSSTVEMSKSQFKLSEWAIDRLKILAFNLRIGFFLIQYDREGWFRLWGVRGTRLAPIGELDEEQMKKWHINLGKSDPFEIPEQEVPSKETVPAPKVDDGTIEYLAEVYGEPSEEGPL